MRRHGTPDLQQTQGGVSEEGQLEGNPPECHEMETLI